MKSLILFIYVFFLNGLILSIGNAEHDRFHPQERIEAAAKNYLKETVSTLDARVEIEISPLDHRLRLQYCEDELETFSPPGASSSGKTTVGVSCSVPTPWTLYVSANIAIIKPVVVSQRDLHRGAVIKVQDVKLVATDTSGLLRGYYADTGQVIGRTLRRSIRRDQVITPSRLIIEKTVKRGEEVNIIAGDGSIQVRMKGKALRNGNPGDLIPVQNLASKKRFEARVISAGNVRVD